MADEQTANPLRATEQGNRTGQLTMAIKEGSKAPAFNLPSTGKEKIRLSSLSGKHVVLYFYPRDNTPGCTKESEGFAAEHPNFEKLDTLVFGVSTDSIKSHEKFKAKLKLPFELLYDEEGEVAKKYDCMKLKKMYGREFMGVERSTFLIDSKGVIRKEWRKVKVPGHVEEVLQAVQELDTR